jgi:hypothetical protein
VSNPNLEDQVHVFMSPSDTVAQLCPQALGSLFVPFYDSQGYGGGILTRLHTGKFGKYVPIFMRKPVVSTLFPGGRFLSAELRGVTTQKRKSNFYNVTPYSLVNRYHCFGGISCFHLQGRRIRRARMPQAVQNCGLFPL